MQIALALVLTLVSACLQNLGYLFQHDVSSRAPPLSLRRPIASLRSLLTQKRWLLGIGVQAAGFVLYVVALALAPGERNVRDPRGHDREDPDPAGSGRLDERQRRERIGAAVSVVGLALLGLSLLSTHDEGTGATYGWVGVWLAASAGGAVACVLPLARAIGRGPAWGIASGILFAAGDVSTKMAVSGGIENYAFLACLIVFYASGTAVLQAAFQQGSALTTAGLSTLLTNALPILAGMVLFHEPLPSGWIGAVRIVAFAGVVAGAVLLATKEAEPSAAAPRGSPFQPHAVQE